MRQFEEHLETYCSGDYSEAQLRVDFLNPLLECLGWDVNNNRGWDEAYREVVYENAIKVGGTSKAPDYGFYIGGRAAGGGGGRKFFLEAKKPAVAIRLDPAPAFQLRRYAYSAQLPLSILTNFKDFIVYDTRYRPSPKDKATAAAIIQIKFTEYADRWHEIAEVLSRDAILKGAFDKYAVGKRRKGMEPLGDAFLEDIEGWRKSLAKDIAEHNPKLTVEELNFAVQRTIDRILFLRICEDRGIEAAGNLKQLLNGDKVYQRLGQIFRFADDRYNSGIFHFPAAGKKPDSDRAEAPDDLTLNLDISDKAIQSIIRALYDSGKLFTSYAYAVIPPDILGHVYEQFLGKVISLTAAHHVKIEEKPEVRKAGGVYYTPTYIVDYIVRNTVGKLLEGKSPKDAETIRILDPASGSGSFLIGAYQFLLNWHLDWYLKNKPDEHCTGKNPPLTRSVSPPLGDEADQQRVKEKGPYDYRLSTQKRKEILLNSIYGVDIDPQAVEVTKLSLLLKVLEGESQDSLSAQMKFFHQRALPDLGRNIKCGNSLIGDDFDDGELDEAERRKINKFNWEREFPAIFKAGGFDAVIGNPPYIFTREQIPESHRVYFAQRYAASWEKQNTFMLFMEVLLRLLGKQGVGGFIVPNSWLTIESAKLLRTAMVLRLLKLVDFGFAAFERVSMEPCIFVASGQDQNIPISVARIGTPTELEPESLLLVDRKAWTSTAGRFVFGSPEQEGASKVIDRVVASSSSVGVEFDVRTGLQAYEKGKGDPPQSAADVRDHVFDRDRKTDSCTHRYLEGRDVARYEVRWSGGWMRYGPWLSQPRDICMFSRPRVLLREITGQLPHSLHAVFLNELYLNNKSILNVLDARDSASSLKLLAGALNSRLLSLYYKLRAVKSERKIFPKVVIKNLREFPFPHKVATPSRDRMVKLVDRMLELHKKLAAAKSPVDKERIPREIESTDRQIDQLVYELYGLTAEEIAIVEQATAPESRE